MAVTLRLAGPQDAASVADIYAPYVESSTATLEYAPPPAAEIARRMAEKQGLFPWLIAQEEGRVLGYAYAGRLGVRQGYDWACEVSIYTADDAGGRRVGRALYTALLALLTAQGYRSAVGILSIPNPASERFHQRMGFVRQGFLEDITYKFGRVCSIGYYTKCLLPPAENPPQPVPFSRLEASLVQSILDEATQAMGARPK